MRRPGKALRLLRAAPLGVAVGCSLLALDLLLLRLTRGFGDWPALDHVLAYGVTGGLLAAVVALAGRRQEQTAPPALVASVVGLLYAIPLVERIHHVLPAAAGAGRLLLAAIGGALAYALWLGALRVASGTLTATLLLAGLSTAVALAVNRNLVDRPFGTTAILLDAAVALLSIGVALAVRRYGWRAGAVAGAVVLLAALLLLAASWRPRPGFGIRADGSQPATDPLPPHLVLVVIDTLRLDVFEDVVATTPEGRRFARSLGGATWFRNAIAVSPWTVPSVGTILTGLYPSEHRFLPVAGDVRNVPPLPPGVTTLAQRLARAGYHGEGLVTHSASWQRPSIC